MWCFPVKVDIEEEALAIFNELIDNKKVEDKGLVNFIESGNGIILFRKQIIHPICKFTIKKQINLLKISFSIKNLLYNSLLKKKWSWK